MCSLETRKEPYREVILHVGGQITGQDPGNTILKCSQKEKTEQGSARLREESGCLESEKKEWENGGESFKKDEVISLKY